MLWRSARPVASGNGARLLATGSDSPVSAASARVQLRRFDQARIGHHRIACRQQDDVARHQPLCLDQSFAPAAQHPHMQFRQAAQRGHRSVGPAFLECANQRIDQHHGQDHSGITAVAERHRQQCGNEQDVDQRTLQLARESAPHGPPACLGQRIRAMFAKPPLHLFFVETGRRVDPTAGRRLRGR
jgi:hypothetical protein